MSVNLPSSAGPLPPIAQVLAEAALQRQSTLLGVQGLGAATLAPAISGAAGAAAVPWLTAAPAPTSTALPIPVLPQADQTHISAQAREALGAGFDPRGAALLSAGARAGGLPGGAGVPLPMGAAGAGAAAGLSGALASASLATAAWPAAGLETPLRQMVHSLVQQLTAQVGPQRVVAAQVWPLALAHALESGAEGGEASPMQTWLVRQGTVQTADGLRGLALTLRVPASWLASQATQAAAPATAATGSLQTAYTGAAQNLQSGVLALVLQGMEPAAARTSALLVLDFQPLLAAAGAAVYGRDMLQARHDPWVQQAQLQASGQLAKEEEIAREREREAGLCQTVGCPYALRASCAQPFCLEMSVAAPVGAPRAVREALSGRPAEDATG
ncbi:hypothetical protein [Simplicispira psychrophila]|uniref:hypothetical protein n=1 Tax=Simplicispira psychrophila TaxID=80882 RepID=UPI000AB01450|nr:hypothetical protein [Simplicispira psychrophila]